MNNKRIGFHDRNLRSLNDASLGFLNPSRENLRLKQICRRGLPLQPPQRNDSNSFESFVSSVGISPPPSLMSPHLPTNASKCVGSTPDAFYAAERLMGFPQLEYQPGTHSLFSQSPTDPLEFSSCRPSDLHLSMSPVKQNNLVSQSWDTLESLVKFPLQENGNSIVTEVMHRFPHGSPEEVRPQPFAQINKASVDGTFATRHVIPYHSSAGRNSINSLVKYPNFQLQKEELLKASAGVPITSTSVSSGVSVPCKTRIRWTQDLHEKFVESVNRLGGAEKATPKGILKQMNSHGLTIYHVKSHLQKYRIAKYMPDSSEGKSERRTSASEIQELDPKTGLQITEALRMQLEVQRHLHEQIEIQRNLQMRIEEQGKKLQKMFEEQMKSNGSFFEPEGSDTMFPVVHPAPPEDDDVQTPGVGEGSKNTHCPSKIS